MLLASQANTLTEAGLTLANTAAWLRSVRRRRSEFAGLW